MLHCECDFLRGRTQPSIGGIDIARGRDMHVHNLQLREINWAMIRLVSSLSNSGRRSLPESHFNVQTSRLAAPRQLPDRSAS